MSKAARRCIYPTASCSFIASISEIMKCAQLSCNRVTKGPYTMRFLSGKIYVFTCFIATLCFFPTVRAHAQAEYTPVTADTEQGMAGSPVIFFASPSCGGGVGTIVEFFASTTPNSSQSSEIGEGFGEVNWTPQTPGTYYISASFLAGTCTGSSTPIYTTFVVN